MSRKPNGCRRSKVSYLSRLRCRQAVTSSRVVHIACRDVEKVRFRCIPLEKVLPRAAFYTIRRERKHQIRFELLKLETNHESFFAAAGHPDQFFVVVGTDS